MATPQERHWRRLGRLLVEEGVVDEADLEYALEVQRENGGLLGEILVTCGFATSSEISAALGRQYGVRVQDATELRERRLRVPSAPPVDSGGTRTPLGRLLVERGLLSESGLERALVDQRQTGRLLGEIVVSRGWVSAEDLRRAIAEQEGETSGDAGDATAVVLSEPETYEILLEGSRVHECTTFLDATDLAFELIERQDPERVEIVRVAGGQREAVWSYSRPDAGPGSWGAGWPLAPRAGRAA